MAHLGRYGQAITLGWMMSLFHIFTKQFRHTMELLGIAVSVVYIIRYLGFYDKFVLPYVYLPIWIVGLFIGLVIKDYYNFDLQ